MGRYRPVVVAGCWVGLALLMGWLTARILVETRTVFPVDVVVYRNGGSAYWDGLTLYQHNLPAPFIAEGLPFTYPPFAALMLWPTNIGSVATLIDVWSGASVVALVATIYLLTPRGMRWRGPFVFAASAIGCATTMMENHLAFGQINIFLMLMVIADCVRRDDTWLGRHLPRGVLVGIAAAIKMTPALFIVYFLVTRQWKLLRWSLISAVGVSLLAWAIRPSITIEFLRDGIWQLGSKVAMGGSLGTSGNQSMVGLANWIGDWAKPIGAVAAVGVALLGVWLARKAFLGQGLLAGALVIGLTAPMVSPVAWVHHWVYLIAAWVFLWLRGGRPERVMAIVFAAITIAAWPSTGDDWIDKYPAILAPAGFALREMLVIMGMITIAFVVFRGPRQPSPVPESATSAAA